MNNTVPSECPALEQSLTDVQLPQFNFDFSLTPGGGGGTGGTGGTGTTLNVGYIRQCIVNAAFDFIADFDVYRLVKNRSSVGGGGDWVQSCTCLIDNT